MISKELYYLVMVYLYLNLVYFNYFFYCEVFFWWLVYFLFEIIWYFVVIDINIYDVFGVLVEIIGKFINDELWFFFCINNLIIGRLVEICILGELLFNLWLKCCKKLFFIKKFGKGIFY